MSSPSANAQQVITKLVVCLQGSVGDTARVGQSTFALDMESLSTVTATNVDDNDSSLLKRANDILALVGTNTGAQITALGAQGVLFRAALVANSSGIGNTDTLADVQFNGISGYTIGSFIGELNGATSATISTSSSLKVIFQTMVDIGWKPFFTPSASLSDDVDWSADNSPDTNQVAWQSLIKQALLAGVQDWECQRYGTVLLDEPSGFKNSVMAQWIFSTFVLQKCPFGPQFYNECYKEVDYTLYGGTTALSERAQPQNTQGSNISYTSRALTFTNAGANSFANWKSGGNHWTDAIYLQWLTSLLKEMKDDHTIPADTNTIEELFSYGEQLVSNDQSGYKYTVAEMNIMVCWYMYYVRGFNRAAHVAANGTSFTDAKILKDPMFGYQSATNGDPVSFQQLLCMMCEKPQTGNPTGQPLTYNWSASNQNQKFPLYFEFSPLSHAIKMSHLHRYGATERLDLGQMRKTKQSQLNRR